MSYKRKAVCVWLFLVLFGRWTACSQMTNQPAGILTNAAEVLSLSAEEAGRWIKVSIKGVVTAAEPGWDGRFFVQDASGGVFVDNVGGISPVPGDVVSVSGISYPGGYAPCVTGPSWKKIGTAPLPDARPVTIEQFMSGTEDSQRVKISGVVRTAWTNSNRLGVELVSGGYRFHAYAPIPPGIKPQTLVGAKVQVRGTAAVSFNAPLRHFISVVMFCPLLSDFIVEEPVTVDPFKEPLTPLNGIAQYRKNRSLNNRIHVKGVVTYQRKGVDLFIEDSTGGLQIKTAQTGSFLPGDAVEAVGFSGVENFLPVLEDATVQKISESRTNIAPQNASVTELQRGLYHASYITVRGKLLDHLGHGVKSLSGEFGDLKTVLVIQSTNFLFTAEKDTPDENASLTSIPIGSVVEVSGTCLLQSGEDGKIKSAQILLSDSDSVRIISKPSWFTSQHLFIVLTLVLSVLLVAVSWTIMVYKKNSALSSSIHEKELAQHELQKAHDTLEWRVKERTEQLKFQITARKESELQFRAVLTERTRLAQELHDTLEQTLTGISLQLATVAKLFSKNPDSAFYHLGLVRNMMRQSQVDLRRSIWDLRSRELEEFDLPNALLTSARQIADSAGVRVEIETKGFVRPLPEVVEENLLRIGQEALTNVVKHSEAHLAKIRLEYNSENVVLEIADDGKGFAPESCVGPNNGHFGLLGMSERAKRFSGNFSVASIPGKGTTVRVEFPTEQTQPTPPKPEFAETQIDYEAGVANTDSRR
ncbi:MAG TPA: histidine kinase [Verrucomicrobiae bacterium]|nr:histidine kinase [Verrucomicrobiae bacterium]